MHLWGMYQPERESLKTLSGSSGTKAYGYTCAAPSRLRSSRLATRVKSLLTYRDLECFIRGFTHAGCDLSLNRARHLSPPTYRRTISLGVLSCMSYTSMQEYRKSCASSWRTVHVAVPKLIRWSRNFFFKLSIYVHSLPFFRLYLHL